MDERTPRSVQTRETEVRQWKPASNLPDPTPEPGYGFRWIATHIMGEIDPMNVSKKSREGWEPVRAKDHPEFAAMANPSGNIEIGGLMLCKMPEYMIAQRDAYYLKQTEDQTRAIDNTFKGQSDPRMPLFSEKKSSVTRGQFGSGSV